MKKIILIILFLICISALGQECGCVTPTQYKATKQIGKTNAIMSNPYENFKIVNPKYLDYKGKTSDGECVRLTFGYGNVSVKKGHKKPKAYIDGIVMDETKLRGILCLNGNKYIVIGRYEGETYWTGAVYSFIDKPALFGIRWVQWSSNGYDIEFIQDDDSKNIMNNIKLVEYKKVNKPKKEIDPKPKADTIVKQITITNNPEIELINKNVESKSYGGSGNGGGSGYSLGNRKALNKPAPNYNCNEEGKVVVQVTVDRNGNTISVVSGVKGTTSTAKCLLDQARISAMNTKWQASEDAPERQVGKIVFNFSLN